MDQNQPPFPLLLAILLGIAASISVWWSVFRRWHAGQVIVPREPRRPVPWHAGHVIALLLIYVVTQVAVVAMTLSLFEIVMPGIGGETLLDDGDAISPETLAPVLLANAMANLIVVGVAMGLLNIAAGATPRDFGFLPWRPIYDIPLGVAAFLASLLPVYAIQLVLTQFFPSEHPVQQLLTSDSSAAMLALCAFSAVLVAPIAEEFLFRGILQGWLEAAMLRRRGPELSGPNQAAPEADWHISLQVVEPSSDAPSPAADAAASPYQSPVSPTSSLPLDAAGEDEPRTRLERMLPVGVSSFLFAIVHLGNGPDPIPLFVLALILGYLYQQTHRLWPCIVLHMCLNAASLAMLLASLGGE